MKKILNYLAIVTLVPTTVAGTVISCNQNKIAKPVPVKPLTPSSPKQTPLTPSSPKQTPLTPSDPKASTIKPGQETAQGIANKLKGKTVKVNPTFWGGHNVRDYKTQLQTALVQQHLLNQDEAQYVTGANQVISEVLAYHNLTFKVVKNGRTANVTGMTVDASESNQAIIQKVQKGHITFSYNYWKNKNVRDHNYEIETILVNEGILNRIEANWVEMMDSFVFNAGAKDYQVPITVDNFPPAISAKATFHLVNDGRTAQAIANDLKTFGQMGETGRWSGNNVYFLKENTTGLYADDPLVMKNFRDILKSTDASVFTQAEINDITFPHVKLTNADNGNYITATVKKGNQTATVQLDIVAYNTPYFIAEGVDDLTTTADFQFAVNLTPAMITYLYNYFSSHSDESDRLGYFYQVLDDGTFNTDVTDLPYEHAEFMPWWNRLENYMDGYGRNVDTVSSIADSQSNCGTYSGYQNNLDFEKALYHQVMQNVYFGTYVSVEVSWYYGGPSDYETTSYRFW